MASRYPNCDPDLEWETQSDSESVENSTSDDGKLEFMISKPLFKKLLLKI